MLTRAALVAPLLVLIASGCGGKDGEAEPSNSIENAHEECRPGVLDDFARYKEPDVWADEMFALGEGGSRLDITTSDYGNAAIALRATECVLSATDAPPAIRAQMGQTSAMSGPRNDSYADVVVEWTYSAKSDAQRASFIAVFKMEN